jgi:hypothetical protein
VHRFLAIGLVGSLALAFSSSATAWSWPADGAVLRPFALGPDAYAADQHRGIDVAGPDGSDVRSPASGVVSFAGSLPTYGRGVTILTEDGYAVTLVHLGEIRVAKGDAVTEGGVVGTMGTSGTPEQDAPSVHLGIRRAADEEGYVDPLGLLPPRAEPAPVPVSEPLPAPSASPAVAPGQQPSPPEPPAAAAPTAPVPVPVSASANTAPASSSAPAPANASLAEPDSSDAAAGDAASPTSPAAEAPAASSAPRAGIAIQAGNVSAAAGDAASAAGSAAPGHTVPAEHQTGRIVGSRAVTPLTAMSLHVAATTPMRVRASVATEPAPTPIRVERSPVPMSVQSPGASGTEIEERADVGRVAGVRGVVAARGVPADPPLPVAVTHNAGVRHRSSPETAPSARVAPAHWPGAAKREAPTVDTRLVGLPEIVAGLVLAAVLAVAVGRRVARRIRMDGAVLRHHADLLRQLDAAHRARVHDRGRGRVRPPSAAART